MRNKLNIQRGEDVDDEDDEARPADKDKLWGKNKRGYYGAETQDYEVTFVHVNTAVLVFKPTQ